MSSASVNWTRLRLTTQADCAAAYTAGNDQRFSTFMAGFGLIFDGWVDSLSFVKENSSQCRIYLSESPFLRLTAHGVAMYLPMQATHSDSRLQICYDTIVKPRTSTHPLMTPYSINSDERGDTTICNDELCTQSTYVQIVYTIYIA